MEGWTEEEFRNRNLMAPCGLYCGTCGIYIANRDGNEKFGAVMGNLYGTDPEETVCLGCMQPDPPEKLYGYCKQCKIRECVRSKDYYSCHQCEEWPCAMIKDFPLATGAQSAVTSRCRSLSLPAHWLLLAGLDSRLIDSGVWMASDRGCSLPVNLHRRGRARCVNAFARTGIQESTGRGSSFRPLHLPNWSECRGQV